MSVNNQLTSDAYFSKPILLFKENNDDSICSKTSLTFISAESLAADAKLDINKVSNRNKTTKTSTFFG